MIKNKLKGVTTFAEQHIMNYLKNCNKYYYTNAIINMTQNVSQNLFFSCLVQPCKIDSNRSSNKMSSIDFETELKSLGQ